MDSEEKRIYSAILIACFVIGSVFIYFLNSLLRQQRRNLELRKRNNIAEISAMEKERNRIASDLHDDINPFLTAVKMNLSELETVDEEESSKKKIIIDNINEIIKRLREIAFDLMPTALLRKGLISGINELIARTMRTYSIDIVLVCEEKLELPEQKTINIFRVVQEIVHNAVKHSGATEIMIVFEKTNGLLTLKIADNGIGFDYEEQFSETTGFGLKSIQNRIELMGGQVFVQSLKGKGLSYVFEIPVDGAST